MVRRFPRRALANEVFLQGPDLGAIPLTLQKNVPEIDSNNFLIVSTIESGKRAIISANFLTVDDAIGAGTIAFDGIFMQIDI